LLPRAHRLGADVKSLAEAGLREESAARKQSLTLLKQVLRVVKPWSAMVLRARAQRFTN
jgi:hypothetical protein